MRPLKYWNGSRYCRFVALPYGRETEGVSGRVAPSLSRRVGTGMRLTRSLPSAPCVSARDPFQYSNGLI
jgi:hypothetical protein